jgi:quercetin dioxygenase-like cupin family protein
MSERKPTEGQLSPNLPGITAYLTGHDDKNGDTIIVEQRPARWEPIDNNGMAFNVPFTTARFPPSMKDNMDIAEHDARLSSGKLGIVNPNGTVLRCVDFAPGFESMMHRTQSLDYGIVIEGSIELILDSGKKQMLHRGDVCVQRGTNHAWRNPSETQWTRVMYVLQDAEPLKIKGQVLEEYLGRSEGEIPHSRQ